MHFPAFVSVLRERERQTRARFRGRESAREKKGLVEMYRNDTRVSKDVVRERNGKAERNAICERGREREETPENAN